MKIEKASGEWRRWRKTLFACTKDDLSFILSHRPLFFFFPTSPLSWAQVNEFKYINSIFRRYFFSSISLTTSIATNHRIGRSKKSLRARKKRSGKFFMNSHLISMESLSGININQKIKKRREERRTRGGKN